MESTAFDRVKRTIRQSFVDLYSDEEPGSEFKRNLAIAIEKLDTEVKTFPDLMKWCIAEEIPLDDLLDTILIGLAPGIGSEDTESLEEAIIKLSRDTAPYREPKAVTGASNVGHQLYQHITVFGRPGHFISRIDNDVNTEETHSTYNEALFRIIRFLASCGT